LAIKLLIVDGHTIVRAGIKKMLTGTGIKVVADVGTGSDAECVNSFETATG
jgi:DNA-binding NarL/FixJ family response regulator